MNRIANLAAVPALVSDALTAKHYGVLEALADGALLYGTNRYTYYFFTWKGEEWVGNDILGLLRECGYIERTVTGNLRISPMGRMARASALPAIPVPASPAPKPGGKRAAKAGGR